MDDLSPKAQRLRVTAGQWGTVSPLSGTWGPAVRQAYVCPLTRRCMNAASSQTHLDNSLGAQEIASAVNRGRWADQDFLMNVGSGIIVDEAHLLLQAATVRTDKIAESYVDRCRP